MKLIKFLCQSTPANLEVKLIVERLGQIPQVQGIHHVHVWNLTDKDIHFEGHVDVDKDMKVSESQKVLDEIQKVLASEFEIDHVTVQFECNRCKDKSVIINENRN